MVDITVHFGVDIDRSWSSNNQGDFLLVSDHNNALQAIKNRLLTQFNELESLGLIDYGNEGLSIIGSTDFELAAQLLELDTNNCLLSEPRVESIVNISVEFKGDSAIVDITFKLIGEDNTTNLILNIGETL